jgi:hypothetical protein
MEFHPKNQDSLEQPPSLTKNSIKKEKSHSYNNFLWGIVNQYAFIDYFKRNNPDKTTQILLSDLISDSFDSYLKLPSDELTAELEKTIIYTNGSNFNKFRSGMLCPSKLFIRLAFHFIKTQVQRENDIEKECCDYYNNKMKGVDKEKIEKVRKGLLQQTFKRKEDVFNEENYQKFVRRIEVNSKQKKHYRQSTLDPFTQNRDKYQDNLASILSFSQKPKIQSQIPKDLSSHEMVFKQNDKKDDDSSSIHFSNALFHPSSDVRQQRNECHVLFSTPFSLDNYKKPSHVPF